ATSPSMRKQTANEPASPADDKYPLHRPRKTATPPAVENAVDECESRKQPEVCGQGPERQRKRHPGEHRQQRETSAEPVGQTAEKEASGGAAGADRTEEQDG